jgi:hypothetical protein
MSSRPDDDGLVILCAQFDDARRCAMQTEINHHVALGDGGGQIIARINLPHDFELAKIRSAGHERSAHAAFDAGDDNFGHD